MFTKEQVEKDAVELNGAVKEDELFYSIVFPFNERKDYILSGSKNKENDVKN
tara:strand:- start:5468 stop:5623 length:156 start_codon:yes stop_codon:yes gene_type:complete